MELGLVVRMVSAVVVQAVATRRGTRCLFPDTDVYWHLARLMRRGEPLEVLQWGVPHFALRTPGYPAFLAACQMVGGDRSLPARLAQAALGALCVPIAYALTRRAVPGRPVAALAAATLVALDPWTIGLSSLLLSEAVFVPLLLLGLLGLAMAWAPTGAGASPSSAWGAVLAGLAWGAAVLVKPSFALFPPLAAGAWVVFAGPGRRRGAMLGAMLLGLAMSLVMAPWWARNARLFDRFVPTALWSGASLYDGLGPTATGASDMRFLDAPDLRAMTEEAQDAELTRRAVAFARDNPGQALRLAVVKAGRYFSPWPNAESMRSPWVNLAAGLVTAPVFAMVLGGAWRCRRDARALLLLAGPLVYFLGIHMVFVSSVRYRLPGMVPAFGLAGVAVATWLLAKVSLDRDDVKDS
jgi:4-amino-4-deoxy-L-arabinose transferase-like glycosyltransferase